MLINTVSPPPTRPTSPAFRVDSTLTAADLGRLHFAESSAADEREKESFVAKSRKRRRTLDAACDRLRAHADALQAEVLRRPIATAADALAVAVAGWTVADVAPDDGWAGVVSAFNALYRAAGRLGYDLLQPWATWTGQEDNRGRDWCFMRTAFARTAMALDGREGVTLADFIAGSDFARLRGRLH